MRRRVLSVLCLAILAGAAASAQQPPDKPREPVPPVTEADRAAAFPQGLDGHAVHDTGFHTFVLFDQLEWAGGTQNGLRLKNSSWFGGDIDRLWLRVEGESSDGRLENAQLDALWGRSFSRWWDVVLGVRQDVRPGDPQTWAAVGIQGLAPYWFELEGTAYFGASGRTQFQLEAEYELLLTNRLVLQPLVEATIAGKSDPERGVAPGLSSMEGGLRLRYEIRRELAPYVGVTFGRKFFGTADLAREEGERVGSTRFTIGLRTWF